MKLQVCVSSSRWQTDRERERRGRENTEEVTGCKQRGGLRKERALQSFVSVRLGRFKLRTPSQLCVLGINRNTQGSPRGHTDPSAHLEHENARGSAGFYRLGASVLDS